LTNYLTVKWKQAFQVYFQKKNTLPSVSITGKMLHRLIQLRGRVPTYKHSGGLTPQMGRIILSLVKTLGVIHCTEHESERRIAAMTNGLTGTTS
jgi:hypothetical protein